MAAVTGREWAGWGRRRRGGEARWGAGPGGTSFPDETDETCQSGGEFSADLSKHGLPRLSRDLRVSRICSILCFEQILTRPFTFILGSEYSAGRGGEAYCPMGTFMTTETLRGGQGDRLGRR